MEHVTTPVPFPKCYEEHRKKRKKEINLAPDRSRGKRKVVLSCSEGESEREVFEDKGFLSSYLASWVLGDDGGKKKTSPLLSHNFIIG